MIVKHLSNYFLSLCKAPRIWQVGGRPEQQRQARSGRDGDLFSWLGPEARKRRGYGGRGVVRH